MARSPKDVIELRTKLENILAEVAVMRRLMPVHELRISQVKERTGLNGLLNPALEEVTTIKEGIDAVSEQAHAALRALGVG